MVHDYSMHPVLCKSLNMNKNSDKINIPAILCNITDKGVKG